MSESFRKSTWIRLPRNVLVGHDVLGDVPEVLGDSKLGFEKTLIVTSPTTKKVAGDRVAQLIEDAGFESNVLVVEKASFDYIDSTVKKARDLGIDVLLGVGGGVPIDIAKVASEDLGIPFVSVPTAASHDGITSSRASIPDGETRHSVRAKPPLGVVADTGILAEAPFRLMASGCADIISNYTAVKDWRLAERLQNADYSGYAGALSEMTAEILLENADSIKPGLEESAWVVVKALVSSGVAMSIAGSSRPASGSEHKFSHALDRIDPNRALHGEQCGVGTIMMMYLHGGDWGRIRDALRNIGAPTTADELGFSREEIIEAMTSANEIRPERYTILAGVTREAAERAAETTGVV
ncbi:MAG: NAD(P)-dependent glycerol-1-phosphate dehydrogenase [Halobacteria archaeon]|nr:NAD(P)-dependent glycerol-1-phosphate dehydrogenase [Halobacteria archaeon]